MERIIRYGLAAIFLIALGLSLFHASWLADDPKGAPKLIAAQTARLPLDEDGCIAEPPTARMWNSDYGSKIATDIRRLLLTSGSGADAIVIESEISSGDLLLSRPMDAGCLRNQEEPRISMASALQQLAKPEQFLRVSSADHARSLSAISPTAQGRVFFADNAADIAPLSGHSAFSIESARACASDYRQTGLWGAIPQSCNASTANGDAAATNGAAAKDAGSSATMLLTLDDLGLGLWGWPDRFLARMAQNNIRVIIAADVTEGGITGLSRPEQFSDIASSYNGYIWIDNIEELGPALRR